MAMVFKKTSNKLPDETVLVETSSFCSYLFHQKRFIQALFETNKMVQTPGHNGELHNNIDDIASVHMKLRHQNHDVEGKQKNLLCCQPSIYMYLVNYCEYLCKLQSWFDSSNLLKIEFQWELFYSFLETIRVIMCLNSNSRFCCPIVDFRQKKSVQTCIY